MDLLSRFSAISGVLCSLGAHRWDQPGGHCQACGRCEAHIGCLSNEQIDERLGVRRTRATRTREREAA